MSGTPTPPRPTVSTTGAPSAESTVPGTGSDTRTDVDPERVSVAESGPIRLTRAVGLDLGLDDVGRAAPGCPTGQCPVQRFIGRQVVALDLAWQGLRVWGSRQVGTAVVTTLVVGLIVGLATVLIPNPVFGRDIPPEPWNYPVWILSSVLTGMLLATYVRPSDPERLTVAADRVVELYGLDTGAGAITADGTARGATGADAGTGTTDEEAASGVGPGESPEPAAEDSSERRSAQVGTAAGILAWFAVGCPVCNKIALLALGYSGAMTWFAPAQPYLAGLALVLAAIALVWRLKGQVACATPSPR